MSKLIVTGGAGFIGSHLTDKLVSLGHEVIVVDNLMLGRKEFVNKKAKFYKADIRNLKKLSKIFKGAEAVFHLAADPRLQVSIEDPATTHEINVTGTLNVLIAAKNNNVKKVIFSSSCTVYSPEQPTPFKEENKLSPVSPYGLHKLMGEEYCRLFFKLYGLKTVCLRYFNVFGPRKLATGAYPMVIPIFLDQRKNGQELTVVGDGQATRDYVHVFDVAEANLRAWQSSIGDGQGINIGSGRQASVNEIAALIGGKTKNLPPRPGEMRFVEADISKAKQVLNWRPTITLEQGIVELKKEWGIA